MKKRIFALTMVLCLMLTLLPTAVFAEGCNHTHTDDCYTKNCTHTTHDETCGYVEGKACSHVHDENCGGEENCSHVHDEECGYVEAKDTHTCSTETGCLTLNCQHQHDDTCGYNSLTTSDPQPKYEDTLQEQISKASKGNTVTLEKDVTLTESLKVSTSITIDLAGYSITLKDGVKTAFDLKGVNITITNSSEKVGTVYGNNDIKAANWKKPEGSPGYSEIGVYAVTFKRVKGGETFATQYVKKDSKPDNLEAPQKDGYTFKEWQEKKSEPTEDGNGSITTYTTYDFESNVTGNITLVAEYTPITYTITFDPNGGTLDDSKKTATANAENEYMITDPPTPAWEGHKFLGWFTQKEGGDQIWPNKKVYNADTTLYAHWESETPTPTGFKITFDSNDGVSNTTSTTTNENGKLTIELPTPTRTGYTFDGWYTEKTGGEKVTTETTFDKDTTVYAHWTAIKYSIHFFGGTGATGSMDAIKDVSYGQSVTLTENAFKKEGYTFTGWKGDNGKTYADKESVKNLATEDNAVVELTAQWEKDSTPELIPVTSLSFSQSGYEYGKNIKDITLTSDAKNAGIKFDGGKLVYGDNYGITTKQTATVPTSSGTFEGKEYNKTCTDYFLYVKFQAADGYELDLDAADVKLDGVAAVALTGNAEEARAVFKLPMIYIIEATAGKNGKIEPEGKIAVFEGESITFKITPNTGYGISTMKIDKKNQTTKKTYEFKNVDDGHTIAVTFVKSNGSAKTGDDLRLIWLAGAGVLSLAALVTIVILHNKKKNSK